jgi:hypothetical protein
MVCDARMDHHVNTINGLVKKILHHIQRNDKSQEDSTLEELQSLAAQIHNGGVTLYNSKTYKAAAIFFQSCIDIWRVLMRQKQAVQHLSKLSWRYSLLSSCLINSGKAVNGFIPQCGAVVFHFTAPDFVSNPSPPECVVKLVDLILNCEFSDLDILFSSMNDMPLSPMSVEVKALLLQSLLSVYSSYQDKATRSMQVSVFYLL